MRGTLQRRGPEARGERERLTHVQATSNAGTLEGLVLSVTCARLHETRHLVLGELDLATAESRQRDVGHLEGVGGLVGHCGGRKGVEGERE